MERAREDAQQVALWLLQDMGEVAGADQVAMNRYNCARKPERKQHWYDVSLWIYRLGHVSSTRPA